MIVGRVLGAVGAVVDWSLIHLLAAISDRVEGRGADCYRRADALADMEAGVEVWPAGELEKLWEVAPEPAAHGFSGVCPNVDRICYCTGSCESTGGPVDRSAAVTTPAADNTPGCLDCAEGTCKLPAGHTASDCTCFVTDEKYWFRYGSAVEPGSQMEWNPECPVHPPETGDLWRPDGPSALVPPEIVPRPAPSTTASGNNTTVDHLEAAWNYHQPAPGYSTTRNATIWHCEGCNWNGPTPQAHARHRFQVLADMTTATARVQHQIGGAS